MRARPPDLDEPDVAAGLSRGWGLQVDGLDYVAVGGGSYHWRVAGPGARRHWATADDLCRTPRERLEAALETAAALRQAGLEFVVAPLRSVAGPVLVDIKPRWALALYPFLTGTGFDFHVQLDGSVAMELAEMLGRLHNAPVERALRLTTLLPGRAQLEVALREADQVWDAGPFSERARTVVAAKRGEIGRLLAAFTELSRLVMAKGARHVVTHGEPHPGNVLRVEGGLLLLDWDTVAVASPERDLCWLDAHPAALRRYSALTGHEVDPDGLRLYRLRWRLDDIASFVSLFRAPHLADDDTERWIAFGESLLGVQIEP